MDRREEAHEQQHRDHVGRSSLGQDDARQSVIQAERVDQHEHRQNRKSLRQEHRRDQHADDHALARQVLTQGVPGE